MDTFSRNTAPLATLDTRVTQIRSASTSKRRCELTILLVPGFSQLCLSSLIEPLRTANMLSRRELFRWRLIGPFGEPVKCASGIPICVTGDVESERAEVDAGRVPDAAIVCAGGGIEGFCTPAVMSLLRLYARRGATLFGVNTGTWLLAKAGMLDGIRCTIHWLRLTALSEKFEDLKAETALFIRDGAFITCSGGFAAFDMMIDTIEKEFGHELAQTVCRYMTTDSTPDGTVSVATPASLRLAGTSAKLIGAIRLMEGNLEQPLSLKRIAKLVGTSRRQLERLFHHCLSTTPCRHYLNLRLSRARRLLDATDLGVLEIAVACGFESPSHFSKTFRERFGTAPNSVRKLARSRCSDYDYRDGSEARQQRVAI
ncbi:GlxA family transcriptional regulator [Mesorhizobium waimense]|uniref:GlxA family transcriptional regulator n=1 Tax=Mesorhizobium waimense TaxID=1300307 RepID=A0A3A5K263_9HYPH|nr:GlxA family transcriptional regulator [Mesorhizobium waimense]RJT26759.1 GlxA family transcriptional regulator [Mesorhizobium waimense]